MVTAAEPSDPSELTLGWFSQIFTLCLDSCCLRGQRSHVSRVSRFVVLLSLSHSPDELVVFSEQRLKTKVRKQVKQSQTRWQHKLYNPSRRRVIHVLHDRHFMLLKFSHWGASAWCHDEILNLCDSWDTSRLNIKHYYNSDVSRSCWLQRAGSSGLHSDWCNTNANTEFHHCRFVHCGEITKTPESVCLFSAFKICETTSRRSAWRSQLKMRRLLVLLGEIQPSQLLWTRIITACSLWKFTVDDTEGRNLNVNWPLWLCDIVTPAV